MKNISGKTVLSILIGSSFMLTTVHPVSAMMLYKGDVLPLRAPVHPVANVTQDQPSVLGITDAQTASSIGLRLQKPDKIDFSPTETVRIVMDNPQREPLDTQVLDAYGKDLSVPVIQVDSENQTTFVITPQNHLQPGKYLLVIKDQQGNTYEQEFTRGSLAFNLDKAVYQPRQTASLSASVIGDYGEKICKANISIQITSPQGNVRSLDSRSGSLATKADCGESAETAAPDYTGTYTTAAPGKYTIEIHLKKGSGEAVYTDAFSVDDKPDFVIKRDSLMSFDPQSANPMHIDLTAQQDFKGRVVESVPESFTIKPDYTLSQYDTVQSFLVGTDAESTRLEDKLFSNGETQLEMPFNGGFSISQGYGSDVTDLGLMDFYVKLGLIGHDGIDFALPIGTPLFAVDDGKVISAGTNEYGTTVVIQHSWGRSYYGHLSKTTVQSGYPVAKGSQIGYSGNSGESTGPHLHFAIRPTAFDVHNGYGGKIDPLPFLPIFIRDQNVLGASDAAVLQHAALHHDNILPEDTPSTDSAIETSSSSAQWLKTPQKAEDMRPQVSAKSFERVKQITWNVAIKKGETRELGYMFSSPLLETHLYLLGPLQLYSGDSTTPVYQEQRSSQAVSSVKVQDVVKPLELLKKPVLLPKQKRGES